MSRNITEIKELLTQILNKLETTELKIERQGEDIKTYIEKCGELPHRSELLIAQQKVTRTSIELLREEIEELHQVMKIIFSKIKDNSN